MNFPLYFQLLRERVQGFFLQARMLILMPNGLCLPPKQPWGSPKFLLRHHHLYSHLLILANCYFPEVQPPEEQSYKVAMEAMSGRNVSAVVTGGSEEVLLTVSCQHKGGQNGALATPARW